MLLGTLQQQARILSAGPPVSTQTDTVSKTANNYSLNSFVASDTAGSGATTWAIRVDEVFSDGIVQQFQVSVCTAAHLGIIFAPGATAGQILYSNEICIYHSNNTKKIRDGSLDKQNPVVAEGDVIEFTRDGGNLMTVAIGGVPLALWGGVVSTPAEPLYMVAMPITTGIRMRDAKIGGSQFVWSATNRDNVTLTPA